MYTHTISIRLVVYGVFVLLPDKGILSLDILAGVSVAEWDWGEEVVNKEAG